MAHGSIPSCGRKRKRGRRAWDEGESSLGVRGVREPAPLENSCQRERSREPGAYLFPF
jgi:hypothetical protein